MSLALQIRRYARELIAIVVLVAIATVVSGYILGHQRLRFPWEDVYEIQADFATAQAVTPGQGQNVQVAGVTVGEISEVRLIDGRARVTMEIERPKLARVHRDARMLLRPKTGLNDMSIQLEPGTPGARELGEDDVLAVARTTPQINADEVLAALDADTRHYLATLANSGGRAFKGRAADLRALLRASSPALRSTARVSRAVADRRRKVRRLVHNLRLLSETAATKDRDLARLVETSAATLSVLARREGDIDAALAEAPAVLAETDRALAASERLARRLPATFAALTPTVERLPSVLRDVRPLLREGEPILRTQIRPLVRAARPVARDLRPALADLNAVTPALTRAFDVLNYVVNELAYNPEGPEEGNLFWLTWFAHNAASILSIQDAHGVAWRGQLILSCSSYTALPDVAPLLAPLVGTPACPKEP